MKTASPRLQHLGKVRTVLPEACLACGSAGGYATRTVITRVDFRGQRITLRHEALRCPQCGHGLLSDAQVDARQRLLIEAYQTRMNLLTAGDLRARRKALGFATQRALAEATGGRIAIATLKRVESGRHVQDHRTDEDMRRELAELEDAQRVSKEFEGWLRTEIPLVSNIDTKRRSKGSAGGGSPHGRRGPQALAGARRPPAGSKRENTSEAALPHVLCA